MQTINDLLGLADDAQNLLLIDRYQMGRMKLRDYFIRDQFSEEKHPLGQSKIYFWQHRAIDSCTIKVQATATDSNNSAHDAMNLFISNGADPDAFLVVTNNNGDSKLHEKTDVKGVLIDKSNERKIAMLLIWGNIFLHVQSIGEQDHSINSFLDNLKDHWANGMATVHNRNSDFRITADKPELDVKVGDVVTLSQLKPDDEEQYHTLIYVAAPKGPVKLFKEKGIVKLKIESRPKASVSPVVMLLGVRPDGTFVRSNRLKLNIIEG
jgi:hypothetical protein